MFRRWVTFVLASLALLVLLPRTAGADPSTAHTVPVVVLALDSDDAEEQADALTGALRSRIRASQGWSLVETSQSLGMLTAALRCSSKPIGADCEQRIGDQLKAERYVFGYVTKGPQAGHVTAEVHLYQKGKPDTVILESYADNLKDQNDDNVRAVASRILNRLGGSALGTLVVRLERETGEVVIDGDKRVPLVKGAARLEISPGSHSVEVRASGAPQKRNVLVTVGKETVVDLTVVVPPPDATKPPTPFPTRKVVGGALAAGGVALLVVGTINGLAFLDDQDKFAAHERGPDLPLDGRANGRNPSDLCDSADERSNHLTICKLNDERVRHSAIFWPTAIGGAVLVGAGAYFLFTDSSSESDKKSAKRRPRLVPTFGPREGGLVLSGSF